MTECISAEPPATRTRPQRPLRVIVAHNEYQFRGGEDAVVEAEVELLRSHGHEVHEYRRRNAEINGMGRAAVAMQTLWSRRTIDDMEALFSRVRPDVMHVHNTLPLISPSIYWAADRHAVPVVQTLHNFRLVCPQALMLRDGKVCEDCVGKLPWRGAVRRCYRGSLAQSTMLAAAITGHRAAGTWSHKIARYIALNDFCRTKFVEGGLPAEKLVVKPNFVDLPAPLSQERSGFLFVGRLSSEKGIAVLAEAMRQCTGIELDVAGTGPDSSQIDGVPGLRQLGPLAPTQVYERMRSASALVVPSIWYENFPRTLVEAFACGLPVIASRIGALADLVRDGETGLLFEPGNSVDLAAKLKWAQTHPDAMLAMGLRARETHESTLTGPRNHAMLIDIYNAAIHDRSTVTP